MASVVFSTIFWIKGSYWVDLEKNQHYIASERAKGHIIDGQLLARGGALLTPGEEHKHLDAISMSDIDVPGDYVGSQ
jgi:hypothetical protein